MAKSIFNRVRCAGIDGVIIRTGFGVENPRQIDRRFEEYYSGAKAAGLLCWRISLQLCQDGCGSFC
ncbi:MAG: hypothetical protein L6V87_09430 [Ruminococcus sp.]|nr:MAG: hypothetical protein L6V87_09430 [Ruminococcus sp.]